MAMATLTPTPRDWAKDGNAGGVVVFDIGGTQFRSGIFRPGLPLADVRSQPAVSFKSHPALDGAQLQEALLDYLVDTADALAARHGFARAAISLGAAMNGHTGEVYGSGPLWGDYAGSFHLCDRLAQRAPRLVWSAINDVSAALLAYAGALEYTDARKIMLITVSTGIACRVLDLRSRSMPLDDFGLQGEIGHLPATLLYQGRPLPLRCDCGGDNHLAAFASGRGMAQLSHHLASIEPALWQASAYRDLQTRGVATELALSAALARQDVFAQTLLRLATQPLADVIRHALALDPELDRIVLTGGVSVNLGEPYRQALLAHLFDAGLYLSCRFDPGYFARRLCIAAPEQASGLIGAGLHNLNLQAGGLHG